MDDASFPGFAELLRLLGRGKADQKWYIDLIATLSNGTHYIFSPNYIYVKKSSLGDLEVSNHLGFFNYLPANRTSQGNGSILLSEQQKNAREL